MATLKVDFFESGDGETIIIEFPDGGVGLVDAHPSFAGSRPDILSLLGGRHVHFVCLTHPHADHGRDLVSVVEKYPGISEFWHTNSDINAFIYRLQETKTWPSEVRVFAEEMAAEWANFLYDLYGAVFERELPIHTLRAGEESRVYGDVEVHVLAPEEAVQQKVQRYWMDKADDPKAERPDPNMLSAVLALRLGKSVVLLGADALRNNWVTAADRYRKLKLPKALVLKVPHHGAGNALDLSNRAGKSNYLDLCAHGDAKCISVLFAGDSKHPDERVYDRLIKRTGVYCLANGKRGAKSAPHDLHIELPGARPVIKSMVCQPVVSFTLDEFGKVDTLAGHSCSNCPV